MSVFKYLNLNKHREEKAVLVEIAHQLKRIADNMEENKK